MHEMSIMARVFALIRQTKKREQLSIIKRVRLTVGHLTCLEETALEFAFSAFAASEGWAEMELEIDWVEPQAKCSHCDLEFKIVDRNRVCPDCGNFCQELLHGDELYLSMIEGGE